VSDLSRMLSRLVYTPPGPAADRLRAEIERLQGVEMYGYGRHLAATNMAGQKLSSLHWEAEGSAAGDRASALRRQSRR
jgi:hypothetical protein